MIDADKLLKKYYSNNKNAYDLLVKHGTQICNFAFEILGKHSEFDYIDRNFICETAMLHDIGIFRCNAPDINCYGSHQYIEHGYLGADLLREEGLPEHALVCERHTGSGLTLETIVKNNYPLPQRNMLPISIEEKLICYTDKFFSKSKPDLMFTPESIREKMLKFGKEDLVRFDEMHELFKIG